MMPEVPTQHRTTNINGFGVFENIGGDLSLVKPGLEFSDANQLNDVK